jgi:hypothetical protein
MGEVLTGGALGLGGGHAPSIARGPTGVAAGDQGLGFPFPPSTAVIGDQELRPVDGANADRIGC